MHIQKGTISLNTIASPSGKQIFCQGVQASNQLGICISSEIKNFIVPFKFLDVVKDYNGMDIIQATS